MTVPIGAVIGDTVASADPDPWRLPAVCFYVDRHWLVSTRRRPASCASKLGRAVRSGLAVRPNLNTYGPVWVDFGP